MGRSPCCSKEGLNRGAWTASEDKILTAYIKVHGEGKWRNLPKRAGLKRCGKSCRLRWLNYLRPDIKRGNISHDEEELIIRLHKLLGNRWSLIAGRLPGRTDNEIKNYWNTTLGKKANDHSTSPNSRQKKLDTEPSSSPNPPKVIRTRATRLANVLTPSQSPPANHSINPAATSGDPPAHETSFPNHPTQDFDSFDQLLHCGSFTDDDLDFLNLECHGFQASDADAAAIVDYNLSMVSGNHQSLSSQEPTMFNDWNASPCLEDNANLDLDSLAVFLDSDEWPTEE